jgi:hypothetical protein
MLTHDIELETSEMYDQSIRMLQSDIHNQMPPYYNQAQIPNREQTFYNDFMDKFQGFASGAINGAIDVDVSDAMASFGFNATIFLLLLLLYEILSRIFPSVYAVRKFHVPEDRIAIDLPKSFLPFSWLPSVLKVSWSEVRKIGGLDAYFFLRFIRMCLKITAVSGLWGIIILWPIFGSGGDGAVGWYHFSMANVTRGSDRIWAPALFMWFMVSQPLHFCIIKKSKLILMRQQSSGVDILCITCDE